MTSTISPLPYQFVLVSFAAVLMFCAYASASAQCGETPVPMRQPDEKGCTNSGLNYAIYGIGQPLLAIHGLGASMYSWRNLVKETDSFPGYQIILIDLKGAGNSLKPHDNNYSILTQRDLVYQFIQERNLRNIILVGNSYGGAVSLLLAIHMCEHDRGRLSKLILIDSGGYDIDLPSHVKILRTPVIGWLAVNTIPPDCQAKIVLKDAYYDKRKITEEQIREYGRPIGSKGGRYALLKTGQQAIPKDFEKIIAKYPTIDVPTLILWGLDDKVIPLKIGKMLHAAIGGSRLELINDCGHVPQEEKPAETICWMREFLGLPFKPCPK
jgi:pimeloyl-ACP methyl ester carboxylesterase